MEEKKVDGEVIFLGGKIDLEMGIVYRESVRKWCL